MSKDRLIVVESRAGHYQLQWCIAGDDADMGATLGEGCSSTSEPLLLIWARRLSQGTVPEDDIEHYAATVGAASHLRTEMYTGGDRFGFYWTSKKDVQQALRLAKLRIKEAMDRTPWPQWARDAVANGWKAPKGWKP